LVDYKNLFILKYCFPIILLFYILKFLKSLNNSYFREKVAKKILNILWKMKGAFYFYEPVDPAKFGIHDYFNIIKRPMDFGTIKVNFNFLVLNLVIEY
jgi:hypothetical protein